MITTDWKVKSGQGFVRYSNRRVGLDVYRDGDVLILTELRSKRRLSIHEIEGQLWVHGDDGFRSKADLGQYIEPLKEMGPDPLSASLYSFIRQVYDAMPDSEN